MIIDNKYCVIDVETGGFSHEKNGLAEIAFIIHDYQFKELARYEAIIKPYGGRTYSPEALKVNGLTMTQINAGKPVDMVVKEISDIFSMHSHGKTKKLILVGHNMKFDMGFVESIFKFCGKDIWSMIDEEYICTLRLSRLMWGHDDSMENFKLATCCNRAGVDMGDAHRALADVIPTAALFEHILSNMRATGVRASNAGDDQEFARKHSFKF